jgi:hypothetical protein
MAQWLARFEERRTQPLALVTQDRVVVIDNEKRLVTLHDPKQTIREVELA